MTDETPKKPLPPTLQAAVAAVKKANAPAPAPDTARGPGEQNCDKCGAVFRWVRSDAGGGRTALVARLVQGSPKCDCGYGKATVAGRRAPRP